MQFYKIYLILIIYLIALTAGGNNTDDQQILSPESKANYLARIFTGLNNSTNVVLAIDSSASMDGSLKSAKQIAIEFLKALGNNTEGRIKAGYVSWRHVPVSGSTNLSTNFDDISEKINEIDFTGNTCLRTGLNKSLELLQNATPISDYDIIIIISDGKENCNTGKNFTCEEFVRNFPKDVYIYTIQIRDSDEGSRLLKCLERPIPINTDTLNETTIENPVLNLPTEVELPQRSPDSQEEFETLFNFQVQSFNISRRDIDTNMTISKSIIGGGLGPRIILKLTAPGIRDIKSGVVIAVDSSGSMGVGGNPRYGDHIRNSMPKILDAIDSRMPNSNVSIISWDDDIDFACGPLSRGNSNAVMVPIAQAKKEILENNVFIDKYPYDKFLYLIPADKWSSSWFADLLCTKKLPPVDYYYCYENESTNLSIGLRCALRTLDNASLIDGQNRLDATRKLIILIAGRSEFSKCDENLIDEARTKYYDISTVGIGVVEGSMMEKELIKIAGEERNYNYSTGSSGWTSRAVDKVIEDDLYEFSKSNITNDIILTETIPQYLRLDNNSTQATINGVKISKNLMNKEIQINSDNTTTLRVTLSKKLNMKPDDVIEVSFDTYLDLTLPIDYTSSKTQNKYIVEKGTPASNVSYNWLANEQIYSIPLPENSINIY
jgi:hypothetical protein